MNINTEVCDDLVFKEGASLGFFDMTKIEANEYCRKKIQETGDYYDWHYYSGRVHIKMLKKSQRDELSKKDSEQS